MSKPPESGKPNGDAPKKSADGKEAGKSDGEGEKKVIERPLEPAAAPDPEELTVRPAEDGKLAFRFRNQPWVALLEWFAEIADQPLDWRELPGDYVNLASSGRYSLDEVADLLNRHLLARGFTMVQLEDSVMVLKTEGINPALVPRVEASQLAELQPHQFVRTSLEAGWLSAEQLAEELKPMISSNGRLVALKTTNRIEAMDAASNLFQVWDLLQQELSSESRDQLAPEFELRYVSAEDAKEMLERFLGIDQDKSATPLTPQQMQQMQQMRARGGNNNKQPPEEKKPEIAIVANPRRNSVLIQAPADRLAIAEEFIKRIDVPSGGIVSLADVQSRVEAFRLVSLDPEKLIEIVEDMNILEPSTRIRVDSDSNAVIVSGAAADRFIIESLIERLDGSGREFYVLPVRYRDPRAVAESISFLMGKEEEKEESGRGRSYFSYFGRQEEDDQPQDDFRVTADVQFRQVLLWANESELEEVRSLLVKLGEMPPEGGSRRAVRVLDAAATPETYEYLQRLREQFRQLAPNEVELPEAELFQDPNRRPAGSNGEQAEADEAGMDAPEASPSQEEADSPETSPEDPSEQPEPQPLPTEETVAQRAARGALTLTAMQQDSRGGPSGDEAKPRPNNPAEIDPREIRSAEEFDRLFGERAPAHQQPAAAAADDSAADGKQQPPIKISVDAEGRIVVRSEDTEALDRLEALMLENTPPKRPYRVFYIEHAAAYWVQLNLEDYFAQEEEEEDGGRGFFFFNPYQEDESSSSTGLDQQREMRMISDDDTNSIVVSGATPEQLRTIEELIALWDVPAPVDTQQVRYTKLVEVQYSNAERIAETVKDAYRDLLSSNDKAFTQGNRGGGGGAGGGGGRSTQRNDAERSRDGGGSELVDGGAEGRSGGSNFEFKGKLSIGVDAVGNTLLVSAEGEELLELVVGMIDQLDRAAKPQGDVRVHRVTGSINLSTLESALRVLSSDTGSSEPTAGPAPQPPSPPERRPGGRGGRGGERRAR